MCTPSQDSTPWLLAREIVVFANTALLGFAAGENQLYVY